MATVAVPGEDDVVPVAVVDLLEYVGQRGAGGEGQAQAYRV